MSAPASSTPASSAQPDKLDAAVLKIAGVTVLGAIMAILDTTVVSVALTKFQEVFNASPATVAWTMTGYTLALATVVPLTGWAADRFGTKRLYLASILLFVLGSVLCGMSWSITSLIIFRVLQGLGGGMLMPLGMTIMTRAAGPTRVGRVMAVLGIPMLLGPIGGPILGGWLIQAASWHWIFFINVPIGIVALIYAFVVLPKDKPAPSESFDFLGMLLLSPGLALFLFGVSSIPGEGKIGAPKVLIPAIIGIVLVVLFVLHARGKDHPLIDLKLFKHRGLTISVITMSLFAMAFFGSMLLLPLYFQQVRHQGTLDTGLLLIPQGLGAMITMPIAGKLTDKYGPGKFVIAGLVMIVAGLAVFTQISSTMPYWQILGVLFLMGLGMGMTMMPTMTAAMAALSHHEVARGSTLMNIVQQSAGSVGTAMMSVILTNAILGSASATLSQALLHDPNLAKTVPQEQQDAAFSALADAFGTTFLVAAILLAVALIPAFLLPRRGPELTAEQIHDLEEDAEAAGPVLPMH